MDKTLERVLRVNHAGEYGAVRIYKGQRAILSFKILEDMQKQEEEHLETFHTLLIENKISPSLFQPFWHIGGFVMGAVTALLGEKVAHACTIAVEEVIDEHYKNQLEILPNRYQGLKAIIEKHRLEEDQHRETAIAYGGQETPFFPFVNRVIKSITKSAIWISERI